MLSTERRRHDVHVLFGDVTYDSFSVNTIKLFISVHLICDDSVITQKENILI